MFHTYQRFVVPSSAFWKGGGMVTPLEPNSKRLYRTGSIEDGHLLTVSTFVNINLFIKHCL